MPVTSREISWLSDISMLAMGGTVPGSAAVTLLSLLGGVPIEIASGNVAGRPEAAARPPRAAGTADAVQEALRAQAGHRPAAAADDLPDALARADVVICDLDGTAMKEAGCANRDEYLGFVAAAAPAVWVTISAFGLSGSRSAWAGNELIYLAAGGILDRTRSKARGEPLKPAGFQGSILTGELAALAALHGLDISRSTSQRVHMEVSAQEAVIAGGVFLECSHRLLNCPGAGGAGRYVAPSGEYPCQDGHVFISVLEDHHWAGLVSAMGDPPWTRPISTWADRMEHEETIARELPRWTRAAAKRECAEFLQSHGVPATPVNGPDDLIASAQLADRGFFLPAGGPGGQGGTPSLPVRVTADDTESGRVPRGAPARKDDGRGLRGLRLLDLSQVLGPPLAASWLGAMGADVVKAEDPSRLEMYRRRGPFIDGISDREHGAYFAAANHSKRSVSISAVTPEGRTDLDELVKWADVLIENQTGARRAALRLGREELAELNNKMLVISSSGFGREGPMSGHRAYGQNLQAFSGLLYLTRDGDGQMCHVQTPWADTMTAVVIASLIASYAVGDPGGFAWLDLSMAEVVIRRLGEFTRALAGAGEAIPDGTAIPGWSPSSSVKCSDGRWLAVCAASPVQRESLEALLRREQGRSGPHGDQAGDCHGSERDLSRDLTLLCESRGSEELANLLQSHGIPACPVLSVDDILPDRHLADRRYFASVSIARSGQRALIGLPWRRAGHEPFKLGDVPMMGASQVPEIVGTRTVG